MSSRRRTSLAVAAVTAVTAVLGAPTVAAPALATHDASGPHARPTDDSCPPAHVQPSSFADVPPDSTHRGSIDCVVWWGIAAGRSSQEYAPGALLSREQMASLLRNLVVQSGGTLPAPTRDHFADDEQSLHEESINALAEAGIVLGRGGGSYAPQGPVERGAMATFLVRAYEYRAGETLPRPSTDPFSDDDGSTHEPSIDRAAAAGFAAGTGDGRYAPQHLLRRDQMATFLARVLDLLVEKGLAEPPAPRAGDVDPAFGDGGSTSLAFGSAYAEANDVAVAADGGVVLAGFSSGDDDRDPTAHVAVAKLLADGTPDPAFGQGGLVITPTGTSSRAEAVVVQPDGKVVVGGRVQREAGELESEYLLLRYDPDGSLDPTFGDGGVVTTSFRGSAYLADLVLQPDGRLVAGGSALFDGDPANRSDFALTRYLPDGTLDPGFGAGGTAQTDVRGGMDYLTALALQPDGAILAAGASHDAEGTAESQSTVVRYLPDGSLDRSFGQGGAVRTETGPFETLNGVTVQPDGSVVGVGLSYDDGRTARRVVVLRYDAGGELDTTFGDGGVVITAAAPQSEATDVVVDADGRLLVVGHGLDDAHESGKSWLVVRYHSDGTRDGSFGEAGVVRTPIGKRANAVALQGRDILVAGCDCPSLPSYRGGFESHSSFVAARFRAE